jgi:hypothetical protein
MDMFDVTVHHFDCPHNAEVLLDRLNSLVYHFGCDRNLLNSTQCIRQALPMPLGWQRCHARLALAPNGRMHLPVSIKITSFEGVRGGDDTIVYQL